MTPDDADSVAVTDPPDSADTTGHERPLVTFDDDAMHRDPAKHEHSEHTRDRSGRIYVGLWLPSAGALIAYAIMHRNYWAAFIGVELLLVGWFTLGKL